MTMPKTMRAYQNLIPVLEQVEVWKRLEKINEY